MVSVLDAVKVIPAMKESEFYGMGDEWNALLRESGSNTVFLTSEWLTAWWKAYQAGKELFILRLEKHGKLIGLAPLYRTSIRKFGFFPFRVLALIGDGSADSDYLDWISIKGEEETVSRSILGFLVQQQHEWDLLILNEIPETSPHLHFIRDEAQRRGWYWEETEAPCAFVPLPGDWEKYLGVLKPRMRTKIRSLAKNLQESFLVHFDSCWHLDDIPCRLDSLYDLHQQRWQQDGERGVFASPDKRQFYVEVSRLFLDRGWLRFYSLSVNDQYVAHEFCFEYNNKIFLLQEGYDPKWSTYGVGNVLRAHVFRDIIERNVLNYDFLGGVTSHKQSWGAVSKTSYRITVGQRRWINGIVFTLPKAVEWGKNRLKAILPETVLNYIRTAKGRRSA